MIRKICFSILLAFVVALTCFLANAPCQSPKSTTASTSKAKSLRGYNTHCFDGIIVAAGRWHHYQRWLTNTKQNESGDAAKKYILAHTRLVPGTENINNNVDVDVNNNPMHAIPDQSAIRPGRIVWIHGRGNQQDGDGSKKGGSRVMDHVLICTDMADWQGKKLFELNNYCDDDNENPLPMAPGEPARPDECNVISIADRLNQTVVSKRNAPKTAWDYVSDPFNYNVNWVRKTFVEKPYLQCKTQVFEWKDTDTVETRTHVSEKELREIVIELYARHRVKESDRIRTELGVNTAENKSGIAGVELKRDKENNTVIVTTRSDELVERKVYLPDGSTETKQIDKKGRVLSTTTVLRTGNSHCETQDDHGNLVSSDIWHDGSKDNTTIFPDDNTIVMTHTDKDGKVVDNKVILPGGISVSGKTNASGKLLTTVEGLSDTRVRRYLRKHPDVDAGLLEDIIGHLKDFPRDRVDEIDGARDIIEYQSEPESTASGPSLPPGVGLGWGFGLSPINGQGGGFGKIPQKDEVIEGPDYGGGFSEEPGELGAGVVEEVSSGTDDTVYCPENPAELEAKCAQVNGYIGAFESQGQAAKWTQSIQRAYLFRAQCCGRRWTTEGPVGDTSGDTGHEFSERGQEEPWPSRSRDSQQQEALRKLRQAEQNYRNAQPFLKRQRQAQIQRQREFERQLREMDRLDEQTTPGGYTFEDSDAVILLEQKASP